MYKNLRKNKGITLVALVITIIILLILAGVAINSIIGEKNIIERAEESKQIQKKAEIIEQIKLRIMEEETKKILGENTKNIKQLLEEFGIVNIDKNGKIESITIEEENIKIRYYERENKNILDTPAIYTITYNANGGEQAPESQIKIEGEQLILSNIEPVREGYIFKGWSINPEATEGEYNKESIYTEDNNLNLYAVWRVEKIYLYNSGNPCSEITGGWTYVGHTASNITFASTYMKFGHFSTSNYNSCSGTLSTNNKIDLSEYSNLNLVWAGEGHGNGYGSVGLGAGVSTTFYANTNYAEKGNKIWTLLDQRTTINKTESKFDISSYTGENYVYFSNWGGYYNTEGATMTIYSIWLD